MLINIVNHDNLTLISKHKQLKMVVHSKKHLKKLLNKQIRFFAYPYGGYNKSAIASLKEAGYKMAFTTKDGWSSKHNDILSLHRVWISPFDSTKVFESKISNPEYLLLNHLPIIETANTKKLFKRLYRNKIARRFNNINFYLIN